MRQAKRADSMEPGTRRRDELPDDLDALEALKARVEEKIGLRESDEFRRLQRVAIQHGINLAKVSDERLKDALTRLMKEQAAADASFPDEATVAADASADRVASPRKASKHGG